MADTAIHLTDDNYSRLVDAAEKCGMSRDAYVNKAIEQYLSEFEEDLRDAEIAAAAWKKFEESGERGYTAEEARKLLDL
ncbi:MAG: hypothetical protein NC219_10610 [Prevotella sp.]|nr:hypothetical protein [Prevotella sp.]